MSFDHRQEQRKRILQRAMLYFQALAFAYLAIHAAVAWLAYKADGVLVSFGTLITLGFGDLYWLIRWGRELGAVPESYLAGVAALVCFASWITRPLFDRWVARFTREMLADTADELSAISREAASLKDCEGDQAPPGGQV